MTKFIITCDRAGDIARAAVWQGKTLVDLYVDKSSEPDFAGAIARGKVIRALAGGKTAWIDCGLSEKIYVESASPLKVGAFVSVRIQSTCGQSEGKAWRGAIIKDTASAEKAGLLEAAPAPWQRALNNLKEGDAAQLLFAAREDFSVFQKANTAARFTGEYVSKGPVHDGLDEIIDGLLFAKVPLSGGSHLVIEQTQALVAIDVNGGDATNATAINLLAVREAARQIRLRNTSGIIVIDCLKMKERADASKVVNAFTRVAESDPAGVSVFGLSKLGLLECTRTRRLRPLAETMREG